MSTRKRNNESPTLSDLEGATSPVETPGIMPPPGTPARVRTTTDYEVYVSPNQHDTNVFSDDLRKLAGEEIEDLPLPEPPSDPLNEFCRTWQNFAGYNLHVTRLPDPVNKRTPGQTYNNTCWEITSLGTMPFDPGSLVPQLQSGNNNSGGVFRLFLIDETNTPIPGARLERILIPDPPKQYRNGSRFEDSDLYYEQIQRRQLQPPPQPAPPEKSPSEQRLETLKDSLFEKLLIRALDPPPPATPDPLSALPADTRLALGLLQEGDVLKTAIARITDLAQAPERAVSETWKDKLAEAGIQLVTHNPQIIETATNILSRTVMALASAFAPRQSELVNTPIPVVQHPPAQRVPVSQIPRTGQPQAINGLPETPQPEDEPFNPEDAEIDMMEDITKLLLSDKPLSLNDPVIVSIREDYPAIFNAVMAGIMSMPLATIIQYLCAKSDFCADMFNSSVTGPHLRNRLEELKKLLQEQANVTTAPTEPVTTNPS